MLKSSNNKTEKKRKIVFKTEKFNSQNFHHYQPNQLKNKFNNNNSNNNYFTEISFENNINSKKVKVMESVINNDDINSMIPMDLNVSIGGDNNNVNHQVVAIGGGDGINNNGEQVKSEEYIKQLFVQLNSNRININNIFSNFQNLNIIFTNEQLLLSITKQQQQQKEKEKQVLQTTDEIKNNNTDVLLAKPNTNSNHDIVVQEFINQVLS